MITILGDHKISIEDNGRGIPTGIHPKHGISAVEVVLTILHAGGKFDGKSYKVSGGLHGVGASVVNALAKNLQVFIKRDGKLWFQEFAKGKKLADLVAISDLQDDKTGTKIIFEPDFEIMEPNKFHREIILDKIRQTAYLTRGLEFEVVDNRNNFYEKFRFDGGILDYVAELTKNYRLINESIIYAEQEFSFNENAIKVEIALAYVNEDFSEILSYTNNIFNREGGTHESGLYDSL